MGDRDGNEMKNILMAGRALGDVDDLQSEHSLNLVAIREPSVMVLCLAALFLMRRAKGSR